MLWGTILFIKSPFSNPERNDKVKNKISINSPYILMMVPLLAIYLVFYIIPLLYTAIYSFTDWSNYSSVTSFTGLNNYQKIFSDYTLFIGIKNSLIYAVVNVLMQNVIA